MKTNTNNPNTVTPIEGSPIIYLPINPDVELTRSLEELYTLQGKEIEWFVSEPGFVHRLIPLDM